MEKKTILMDSYKASQGCITVFFVRSNMDVPDTDREREPTEPPACWRYVKSKPRISNKSADLL